MAGEKINGADGPEIYRIALADLRVDRLSDERTYHAFLGQKLQMIKSAKEKAHDAVIALTRENRVGYEESLMHLKDTIERTQETGMWVKKERAEIDENGANSELDPEETAIRRQEARMWTQRELEDASKALSRARTDVNEASNMLDDKRSFEQRTLAIYERFKRIEDQLQLNLNKPGIGAEMLSALSPEQLERMMQIKNLLGLMDSTDVNSKDGIANHPRQHAALVFERNASGVLEFKGLDISGVADQPGYDKVLARFKPFDRAISAAGNERYGKKKADLMETGLDEAEAIRQAFAEMPTPVRGYRNAHETSTLYTPELLEMMDSVLQNTPATAERYVTARAKKGSANLG